MITIEVLISMLILFLVIATSFSNIKFFNIINHKKQTYEELYITVQSLKDKLSSNICQTSLAEEGEFNGFTYVATCTKIQELKTYITATEDDEISGNYGNTLMQLYKITLTLRDDAFEKEYNYYKTISRKLL